MNYTLNQLKIFHKVAEKQSVTKAAEELFLTQPAVSIQLKKLQEQFDVPLFEVIGRRVHITDFGREIAAASQQILIAVQEIKHKNMAFKGHLVGQLKLTIASTAKYVMPYFLAEFAQMHEGIDLLMDVTNKTKVVESLERNEVDFAMVSVLPENLQVERIELMQNKLFFVGSNRKKFGEKPIDPQVLAGLPLIYREQGSATRRTMEQFVKDHQISVPKSIELTSNEAVKQAVLSGLGYSIMPLIGIKNELNSGELQIIPVKGLPITTNWNLVWLKGKKFAPVPQAYLDYILVQKNRIIQEQFHWYERYS